MYLIKSYREMFTQLQPILISFYKMFNIFYLLVTKKKRSYLNLKQIIRCQF